MKSWRECLVILLLSIFLAGITAAGGSASQDALFGRVRLSSLYDETRIVVRPMNSIDAASAAEMKSCVTSIEKRVKRSLDVSRVKHSAIRSYPRLKMAIVEVDGGAREASERLMESGSVQWAEPLVIYSTLAAPAEDLYEKQWYLKNTGSESLSSELEDIGGWPISLAAGSDVDAESVWDETSGDSDIIVAVMDTGVDYIHPDLAASMWRNTEEIPDNDLDDDGNGYVDDYFGWNGGDGNGDPMDDAPHAGHGTHVAGIIAGAWNGLGVAGISPLTRIMALRIASEEKGDLTGFLDAVEYLLTQRAEGVNVVAVNMSFGSPARSNASAEAMRKLEESGILVFAACGNEAFNNDYFPASYPAGYFNANIVAVGASDGADGPAAFSQWGRRRVDLFAPGLAMTSCVPANGNVPEDEKDYESGGSYWGVLSGTSFASPLAAGIGSLAFAVNPEADWREVKSILMTTGDERDSLEDLCRSGTRMNAGDVVSSSAETILFDTDEEVAIEPGTSIRVSGYGLGGSVGARLVGRESVELSVSSWTSDGFMAEVPFFTPGDARMRLEAGGDELPVLVASKGTSRAVDNSSGAIPLLEKQTVTGRFVYGVVLIQLGESFFGGVGRLDIPTGDLRVVEINSFADFHIEYSTPVALGGRIYLFGGSEAGNVYIFDPATGNLSFRPSALPTNGGFLADPLVATDGTYVYVAGGSFIDDGTFKMSGWQENVYRWRPTSGVLDVLAEMPEARSLGAAAVIDGRLILAGGVGDVVEGERISGEQNSVDVLILSSRSWSMGSLPFPCSGGSFAVLDDDIYLLGALSSASVGSPFIVRVDRNDPASNWHVYPRRFDFYAASVFQWAFGDGEDLYVLGNELTSDELRLHGIFGRAFPSGDTPGAGGGCRLEGGGFFLLLLLLPLLLRLR